MSRWRPGPGQQAFDFSRSEQTAIFRETSLISDGCASAGAQKAVLKVLVDHSAPGRPCWLRYETIAAEANYSLRTVKSAVSALRDAGVISVERRKSPLGGVVNHYWVEWTELARRRQARVASEPPARAGVDQGAERIDQDVAGVDQGAQLTADQSASLARPKCKSRTTKVQVSHPKYKGSIKGRPPPPTSSIDPKKEEEEEGICARKREAVERLTASLRDLGIGTARATAEQLLGRVGTIEAAMAAIAEARATVALPINRARLKSVQGAIAWYLGNGVWPTRLISPAAQQAERQAEQERRAEQEKIRRSPLTGDEVAAGLKMTVECRRITAMAAARRKI